jgi:hypothetical protein
MPGFFEGMRRMIIGEPVYKPGETADTPIYQHQDEIKAEKQATDASFDPEHADKLNPPEAVVERFECYVHDEKHMEVNLHIRNQSKDLLWMDKVMLFGKRYDLDRELDPGETREFMVYNGPMLESKYYTTAELHYRSPHGDYFSAHHNIEFEEKENNKYIPHRIRFYGPVRDI